MDVITFLSQGAAHRCVVTDAKENPAKKLLFLACRPIAPSGESNGLSDLLRQIQEKFVRHHGLFARREGEKGNEARYSAREGRLW